MKKIRFNQFNLIPVRSAKCKMQDKFNRIVKIARIGNDLLNKLDSFQCTTNTTERQQCALALKIALFTGMRVGNEDSANGENSIKGVKTYGLTTLKKEHIKVKRSEIIFEFVGKKGVFQQIAVKDMLLVSQIKWQMERAAGENLFAINDYHVRKFVQKSVGKNFMVKDFRTLHANCIASDILINSLKKPKAVKKRDLNAEVKQLCIEVSQKLGNTPAMAKRAYIDPMLIELFREKRWGKIN